MIIIVEGLSQFFIQKITLKPQKVRNCLRVFNGKTIRYIFYKWSKLYSSLNVVAGIQIYKGFFLRALQGRVVDWLRGT